MKAKNANFIVKKRALRIASFVAILLIIPLIGNAFVEGWNWGIADFIFTFIVLFCTGLAVDYASRKITNIQVKIATISLIFFSLLILWVEAATEGISRLLFSTF